MDIDILPVTYSFELQMFPYFDIAHNLLAAISVREDLYKHNRNLKRYPFLTWLSVMLVTFSGSLMANILLGEPVLAPFASAPHVAVATAMWFIVFYFPFDIGYKIVTIPPITGIAEIMKEIYRVRKVSNGVLQAKQILPEGYLVMIVIGVIRGNGAGIFKQLFYLVRKIWNPKDKTDEHLRPTFATISCFVAAACFAMGSMSEDSFEYNAVYIVATMVFLFPKLAPREVKEEECATNRMVINCAIKHEHMLNHDAYDEDTKKDE